MAETDPDNMSHVSGSALAAFGLTVNTLKLLQEKGLIDQRDVSALVRITLGTLEALATEKEAHAARVLLSGIAAQLGVPLSKPN